MLCQAAVDTDEPRPPSAAACRARRQIKAARRAIDSVAYASLVSRRRFKVKKKERVVKTTGGASRRLFSRVSPLSVNTDATRRYCSRERRARVDGVLPGLLVSYRPLASTILQAIRKYVLALVAKRKTPGRRGPNPTILHLLSADALRAVRGPGIDCKHGTGSSSLLWTNASHLSRNSCSPAARGAHNNIAVLTCSKADAHISRCGCKTTDISVSQR